MMKYFQRLISELQRKAESYFQHTENTFSSDTRQSMKRQIIAKHLTEPEADRKPCERKMAHNKRLTSNTKHF